MVTGALHNCGLSHAQAMAGDLIRNDKCTVTGTPHFKNADVHNMPARLNAP